MSTLTIDTHKIADILHQRKFSEEQVRGLLEAAREAKLDSLVTKEYLDMRLEKISLQLTVRLGAMVFALGGFIIAAMAVMKFME